MLFCDTVKTQSTNPKDTSDAGKIKLGGGYRPAPTADSSKIKLGGGYRAPKSA
jgi:hypothetical protein